MSAQCSTSLLQGNCAPLDIYSTAVDVSDGNNTRSTGPCGSVWVFAAVTGVTAALCIFTARMLSTSLWTVVVAPHDTIPTRTVPYTAKNTMPRALRPSYYAAGRTTASFAEPTLETHSDTHASTAVQQPINPLMLLAAGIVGCVGLLWARRHSGLPAMSRMDLPGSSIAMAAVVSEENYDSQLVFQDSEFSEEMVRVMKERYGDEETKRVVAAWRRMETGFVHSETVGTHPLQVQRSSFFIEGLSANPLPVFENSEIAWAAALEAEWDTIRDELQNVMMMSAEGLKGKGSVGWICPVEYGAAPAYGPDWQTLGLMERGKFDEANSELFPRTTQLLRDAEVPAMEVFFAKMPAGSRIYPHTDGCNFVHTAHLGLIVPPTGCTLNVADNILRPKRGEMLLFDSSFMHEAFNDSAEDRVVLLLRIWHPELTPVEIQAISFLFECIQDKRKVVNLKASPGNPYTITIGGEKWRIPAHHNTFDTSIFGPNLTLFDTTERILMATSGNMAYVEPDHSYELRQISRRLKIPQEGEEDEPPARPRKANRAKDVAALEALQGDGDDDDEDEEGLDLELEDDMK
mmetsp:Transcript_62515/g.111384  ORF Transcript_62515/g.111384 Transcript_62515/m.111384 type:complete len:574 (-) Transcript_62515:749-2470(-)